MAYHLKKKITVDNSREEKPAYLKWRTNPAHYMVRSDGGGMSTRADTCYTLTEARKLAKSLAHGASGWAEIFRWAENGTQMRKFHIATYEREISA